MSLGRHSGAMLIGRPLDMSVQAVLEAQDDAGNLCLEADVFYADNKLDKSRVRVTLERSATAPSQAVIRIRATALIDEPVVTLYLRAGCQIKTERRYVSLAELVTEVTPDRSTPALVPSPMPVRPAVVPPVSAATTAGAAVTPQVARPAKRSRAQASAATAAPLSPIEAGSVMPVEAVPVTQAKAQRPPTLASNSKAATPARSRLKLEPLDLVMERDPQLKSSAQLLSIPAANPQERAAASALWRALSAQPQDILRDTEKLQALESSVRGLQAQSQKTLLSIDDLNVKLQQAQAERYANTLVYTLVALLLAALGVMAFLFRHQWPGLRGPSGDKPWWRKNEAYQRQQEAWIDSLPPRHFDLGGMHEGTKSSLGADKKASRADENMDFELDRADVRPRGVWAAASPSFHHSSPAASTDKSEFGSSMLHPSRAVTAEELFDVQQQADFFVSIGQHGQAIELLRSHIAENIETSAVIYLDLFNLYHQLERPDEYDALRVAFNQRFNTQVPTFELYTGQDLGLEAYQHALSRIEALWPSPKVLEIIEESLFRRPDATAEAFNLEAYRELLMLYSVAKEIIGPESKAVVVAATMKFDLPERPADNADSRPMTFMSTAIQPLSASMNANPQALQDLNAGPLMAAVIPPASSRLGLDIDLNELSAPDDKSDSEVDSAIDSQAKFFTNFDADPSPALQILDSSPRTSDNGSVATDNLIDFDVFDVPAPASQKPKLPEA